MSASPPDMAPPLGGSTAHKHLLTILQVISSGRRCSSYAEHANPSVERLESDSKLLTVGMEDFLLNLRRQGDAESLEKECDIPTEAELAVPSKTHLCVVKEEEKESEVLPRGKVTNSSPPCSARHEEEANRDPATPPEAESSPPRETAAEEEDEAEQPKRGGYLHLLVEAARLLEPGFGEDEESERGSDRDSRKRAAMEAEPVAAAPEAKRGRQREWTAAYLWPFDEDIAPVVRSKRGRNQVLPSRYRDSVIEQWKAAARLPRPSR